MNNMLTNRFGHVKWHLGWVVDCCLGGKPHIEYLVRMSYNYEDFWVWYSLPQLKNEQINMLMKNYTYLWFVILHCAQISGIDANYTILFVQYYKIPNSNSRICSFVVYGKLRTCTWKPAVGASHSVKRTNRKLNGVLCWRKTMLETKKAITLKCDPIIRDYIDINSPSLPQIFTMCVKSDRLKPVIMKMAQQ